MSCNMERTAAAVSFSALGHLCERFVPSSARGRGRPDQQAAIADLDLHRVTQARLFEHGLGQANALGISDLNDVGLYCHDILCVITM